MSKKEIIVPNYSLTQGFLKQKADNTLLLIDRDIAEFTDRGFTPIKRTEFETAINDFASFITDEQMSALVKDATATRETERKNVEKQMRTIFLSAKIVFGESSGAFREFGNSDLTRQDDADLVRNARMMVTTATKYLTNLTPEGITEEKISNLDETLTRFDEAIDLKIQSVNNRDMSTEQRLILANNLYALIVKYNDIGKDIWAEESQAKYNDYVIYNTPTGAPV